MNKRMKKKANTYKGLSNKQRLLNQRKTIRQLYAENERLKNFLVKDETISEKTIAKQMEIINELHLERNSLKEQLAHKEDEITKVCQSLDLMYRESSKKIRDLEEDLQLQKKDAIAANRAYEDTEKELQSFIRIYEVDKDKIEDLIMCRKQAEAQAEYWKLGYSHLQKMHLEYVNRPWWKKVLNIV